MATSSATRIAWLGAAVALTLGAGACIGDIGDGGADEEKPKTVSGSLVCDPNLDPSPTPLVRLSGLQYENTLRDLFGSVSLAALVDDPAVVTQLAQYPLDGGPDDSFRQMDQRVSQRHVDTFYGAADALASAATASASQLESLAGACASSAPVADECVSDFIASFGRRVFRRPLNDAESARYLELNDSSKPAAEVFRSIVFVMLMSPQFNYHLEIEGAAIGGSEAHLSLSGFELASRLAYHFWQSMPDDELLDAAASGELDTAAGFAAQVERLFDHERTKQTVERFYGEWYRLDQFNGFAQTPAYDTFADGVVADEALHDAMVAEVNALTAHYTWDADGSYADMITSDLNFAQSATLAELYGVSAWDGSATPTSFPGGERSGVFTRAALVFSANERTSPIKRGAFFRRDILCDELAQPDPSSLPEGALNEPEFDPTLSTRERWEAKTTPQPCGSCHGQFNGFGYALEAFDGLGRFRTEERIISEDGEQLATVPVDAAASVAIAPGGQVSDVSDAVELMEAVAESGRAETCFARRYFRFTYRRHEVDQVDGCQMVAVREELVNGAGLRGALRVIALEPNFRIRLVGGDQ